MSFIPPETRQAISKLLQATSEPKSADVRRVSQKVVTALFDLNPATFSLMLRSVSKALQETANKILKVYMQEASSSSDDEAPPTPPSSSSSSHRPASQASRHRRISSSSSSSKVRRVCPEECSVLKLFVRTVLFYRHLCLVFIARPHPLGVVLRPRGVPRSLTVSGVRPRVAPPPRWPHPLPPESPCPDPRPGLE